MAADFLARFGAALESARDNRAAGMATIYSALVEDRERTLALWDLRTDATDVRAQMERMLQEAYPVLVGDESLPADAFQPRVFSAIALTAFRYVLESGEGHAMDDVREGMRAYLRASDSVLAVFE